MAEADVQEELEESILPTAYIQRVYPTARKVSGIQDVYNLEVSVSRVQIRISYDVQERELTKNVTVIGATTHRFHIQASTYSNMDILIEALRQALIRRSNLKLGERDIVNLAEEFHTHMIYYPIADDEKIVIVALAETIEYCMGKDERVEASVCAICLGEFADGTEVVTTPCAHLFHDHCLKKWLMKNVRNGCPMCRAAISEDSVKLYD